MPKKIKKGGDISNLSGKIERRNADLDFFKQQEALANTDEKEIINRQIESMENKLRPLTKYKNRKQDINMFQGMLPEYPSDMRGDIETKIRELELENQMLEAEILRPSAPACAPQLPPVKILLTDLDNTLLTNVQKEAQPRYSRYNILPFAETKFEHDAPIPDIDIVTTQEILQFLHRVSIDPNILWFVVSAGRNDEKLQNLIGYGLANGLELKYDNPGTEFGLKDKKAAVDGILRSVSQTHHVDPKNVLFIDDEEDKIQKVSELGVNVLPVDGGYFQLLDWWSPTMMTPMNITQASGFFI
jgi:hypothetical protein